MSEKRAGRELDAEVAEEVMGRRTTWVGSAGDRTLMWRSTVEANKDRLERGEIEYGYPGGGDVPEYSTDVAAAFEVVEKMALSGWYPTVQRIHGKCDDAWRVVMDKYVEDGDDERLIPSYGRADTPALAICLAALQAVGARHE